MEAKDDLIRHNCGLCVAHTLHDAYSFIKSLQHRGREAVGIGFIGKKRIDVIKWLGTVDRFDLDDLYHISPSFDYHTYVAHVRYATRGRKDEVLEDAHPHTIGGTTIHRGNHIIIRDCDVIGVHNGQVDITPLGVDRSKLKTECDTEAILHFFMMYGEEELLNRISGAYTLAIADKKRDEVLVLRDRKGIKPGVLGWKDGKCGVASEDVAFKKNGGEIIEDLECGSVYYLDSNGSFRKRRIVEDGERHCFFEYNYIAGADTVLDGVSVRGVREHFGEMLAEDFFPRDANLVTFLPRCPRPAARRYAKLTRLPFEHVYYKPRAERAFLGSTQTDRKKSIEQNLYLTPQIESRLGGLTVIVIDDSTIRGNNSERAVALLKEAGVKKIYLLNYTPKIGVIGEDGVPRGCLYGVDMPPDDDFVVRGRTSEQINQKGLGQRYFFFLLTECMKHLRGRDCQEKNYVLFA